MYGYIKISLSILLLMAISTIRAADITVETNVESVTLYTNQADIIRSATVKIPDSGQHKLIVPAILSSSIDQISVSVEGADLLGQSMVASEEYRVSDNMVKLNQTKQELEVIHRALSDNTELADALTQQLENADSNFDKVSKELVTLREEYQQLLTQQQALMDKINYLTELVSEQKNGTDFKVQQALVVIINAKKAGNIALRLNERSDLAYWQPMSQWYLDSEIGELNITGQAMITQQTGLDWEDIAITLAVMPSEYYEEPYLNEQIISFVPEIDLENEMDSSVEAAVYSKKRANYTEDYAEHSVAAVPIIIQSGSSFEVQMPNQYNLASGHDAYLLSYYHEKVKPEVYSAFYSWNWPKHALLIANWKQPGKLPLIPGQMKLYRDGLFLTERYNNDLLEIDTELTMSFGVDPRIEAEAITPPEYRENDGFIKRDRLLTKVEELRLSNHGDEQLPVRIYARLPVSTEENIKIKSMWKTQPDELDVEDTQGLVVWKKDLAADEVFSVQHGYEIRYPENKSIMGAP
ncbi:MAG: hypothetical protein CSA10_01170 [Cardiobacteriales bacterium]|nr:MAG: hypothetical protein CSA10_01170 [Cardiobacteriales bacterium]